MLNLIDAIKAIQNKIELLERNKNDEVIKIICNYDEEIKQYKNALKINEEIKQYKNALKINEELNNIKML